MRLIAHWALPIGLLAMPATAQAADDEWWGRDKALHFGFSAVIAGAAYGASTWLLEAPVERAVFGGSIALAAGVGKEAYDLGGNGTASVKDLAWDVAGTAIGVGVALLIDVALRRESSAPARSAGVLRMAF